MKTIYIFCFLFLLTFTAKAQIINKGLLKIESGTDVVFVDSYTNATGSTHINEGNLHLKGDFTNNGSTTIPTSGTTFFDSSENTTQLLGGDTKSVNFYNLEVNNTNASAQGLAVQDLQDITVVNAINIENGKIRLIDNAQLIQTHTGTSLNTCNTSNNTLLVDQDGARNAYRYNYWSSPVNDGSELYTVQHVLKDGTTPNLFSPTQVAFTNNYEGDETTNPITISAYWMWKYIDGHIDSYNEADWQRLFDISTDPPSLGLYADTKPGEGFIMKGPHGVIDEVGRQNYSFEGKPNDGDYSITISADREYLVGNPYPSALDANQFILDNTNGTPKISGTLYFWEHWSTNTHVYVNYGGNYATYTLSGGVVASTLYSHFSGGSGTGSIEPKRYIPIGQGFVIRSNGEVGGNVIFNNAQRAFVREGSDSNQFSPFETSDEAGVVSRIRLGYENDDEMHRQLLLAFTDGSATNHFDNGYDGEMETVGADDLYFVMEDYGRDYPYVIQGVGSYNCEKTYPLTMVVSNPGLHTILIDNLENFEEPIYILDKDTNTTTNLRTQNFTRLLAEGLYEDRFEVAFQPVSTASTNDKLHDQILAYFSEDKIRIKNLAGIAINSIQVFNSIGQLVYKTSNQNLLNGDSVSIPFVHYPQASYVLKVKSEKGNASYKFIN